MKVFPLIFLIGIFSPWARGHPITRTYSVTIENHILKKVTPKIASEHSQIVDLSNLEIRGVDGDAFKHLNHVKTLNLSNNELQRLPDWIFANLDKLETLSLANNNFSRLGVYFVGLLSLKTLDLSNNHLTELTRTNLLGLPSSANVIMEGNALMSLKVDGLDHSKMFPSPDHMNLYPWSFNTYVYHYGKYSLVWPFKNNPEKRKTPNFARHSIKEITPELLNNLHKDVIVADLGDQSIKEIKKGVIRNGNLLKVQLDRNGLKTIEDDAFKDTGLRSLTLMHNELEDMEFVETLPTSMIELFVTDNRIKDICGGFGPRLKELMRFIISHNRIKHICPCSFRGLEELREIDLSYNYIEEIHRNLFRDQRKLCIIILSNNKIRVLPPGVFRNLQKVTKIDLNNNEIKKIYRDSFLGVRNYPVLTVDLHKNQIDSIEEGSFANTTISELSLSNNRISENSIDKGAFESCTTEDLSFDDNLFTEINGDAFYGIRVYNEISFDSNHVKRIGRDSMKHMINVPRLTLRNNPIERIESGSFYRTQVSLNRQIKTVGGGAFENVDSVIKIGRSGEI